MRIIISVGKGDGNINLWNVYNLFTQANKSSYIATFLDRNLNAFEFSKGIQKHSMVVLIIIGF